MSRQEFALTQATSILAGEAYFARNAKAALARIPALPEAAPVGSDPALLRRSQVAMRSTALDPVWTAPIGKGFLSASATLVGAAMCPTCLRGTYRRWP